MKIALALYLPLLGAIVVSIGMPDTSDLGRWLLKCFLLTAGIFVGGIALRLVADRRKRQALQASVQRLRREGREVSSSELAQATAIEEDTVQLHLPGIAATLGARTSWYQEGGGRHQKLKWPTR